MGMFVTLAAFAGGYVTGAKVGDRPMVNARNAMKDVRAWATSLPRLGSDRAVGRVVRRDGCSYGSRSDVGAGRVRETRNSPA